MKARFVLLLLVFVFSVLAPLTHPPKTYAYNDDYPDSWKSAAIDSMFDTWGEYNRECTSFVAWRLHSKNGFEMPFHADASMWASKASALSYVVNSSPVKGSVAYSGNHVAWVEDVSTDKTKVTVEEYNNVDSNGNGIYADDGTYSERTVAASMFGYIHFKDIGVVLGTSTTSTANYKGKMIRNSSGTISYVTNNGLRYWVPTMQVVDCLGGLSSVVQVSDTQFTNVSPANFNANCLTKYIDRMIRNSAGKIDYVDAAGLKHWVPAVSTLNCLGGSYIQLDDATFNAVGWSPSNANCQSRSINRMIHDSGGSEVSYIDTNYVKHWVPDNTTAKCLGGWTALVDLDSNSYNSFAISATADCKVIYSGKMLHAPDGRVAYISSDGSSHWVPNAATVGCLGGWSAITNVSQGTFDQLPIASMADCSTR